MKYKLIAFILITLFLYGFFMNTYINTDSDFAGIKNKIVRLHIIANSDSLKDQEIKLRVRDAVLEKMKPAFKDLTDTEKAKEIITDNMETIKATVQEELTKMGKNFPVEVELSKCDFPTKKYGDFTFPEGEYQALNIKIGNGQGKNWWCVMFPPLCFVDLAQEANLGEEEFREVLSKEEMEMLKNGTKVPIKIKFKVAEIYKSLNSKISRLIRKETEIAK